MMAFERRPDGSVLDAELVSELRTVLARSVADGNHPEELKPLLVAAASDARHKGLQAEQLLLALKDIWYSLPQIATHPSNDEQTRLLQQLIARCIQGYYAG